MSLLTQAMEDVVMLEKKRLPDGEGGFTTDWAEGVQFKAAISFDSSMGHAPQRNRALQASTRSLCR